YKFNTFIAMFLIISEIYLFLFRTHVKYGKIIVLGKIFSFVMPIFSIFLSPKPHTGDKFTPLYVIGELFTIKSI
ncbi:hypothetical protein, partial [Phocaeicola vulgatus]